ncbi:hypothetical protein GCM10018953_12280 [Streptosporangium nondiastaticum]
MEGDLPGRGPERGGRDERAAEARAPYRSGNPARSSSASASRARSPACSASIRARAASASSPSWISVSLLTLAASSAAPFRALASRSAAARACLLRSTALDRASATSSADGPGLPCRAWTGNPAPVIRQQARPATATAWQWRRFFPAERMGPISESLCGTVPMHVTARSLIASGFPFVTLHTHATHAP